MPRERILPPVFFLVYLIAALLLNRLLPIAVMVPPAWRPVGWVICGLGAALNVWGSSLFRRRGTTIKPFEPSTALVCDGPFRLSRNPMYVGGVAMLLGVATPRRGPRPLAVGPCSGSSRASPSTRPSASLGTSAERSRGTSGASRGTTKWGHGLCPWGPTVLGSLTAFLAPLAMFLTLQLRFLPHEERMLEETFGSAYRDYRRRVKRWL